MFSSRSCSRRRRHIVGAAADARGVAAELLAERDRHGVLQVRAAGLQHAGELVGLSREARRRVASPRRTSGAGAEQQRQARRGREHVVGRLAHVDVVVRVHARVGARAARRGSPPRGWRAPRSRSCCARCRRPPDTRRRRTDRAAAPPRISSAAATMASAMSRSSRPSAALASARGLLDRGWSR